MKIPKSRGRKHIDNLIASGLATPVTKKEARQAAGKDMRSRIKARSVKTYKPCPAKCNKGRVRGVKCNVCKGTGVVEE